MKFCKTIVASALFQIILFAPAGAYAQKAQSFTDVPPENPAYEAVEYLRSQGVIGGYEDGTFKPDNRVNRAEAVKIIIAPLVSKESLSQVTSTQFSDVENSAWFLPYVEAARQNNIIDGPPKKTEFKGQSNVILAEFLKILELANLIEPDKFLGELKIPLSSDVSDTDAWLYPYMRYAIASSMLMINQDGLLHPEYELKRGDTAIIMFRFMMYLDQRRTQALLSETENEMIITLSMLDQGNMEQAEFSSNRALIASRGALFKRPDEPVVKGAVKISEAFRELVKAYRKGAENKFEEVITHGGNAWNLAAKAREMSPNLLTITDQVQRIAKNMADSARDVLAKQQ